MKEASGQASLHVAGVHVEEDGESGEISIQWDSTRCCSDHPTIWLAHMLTECKGQGRKNREGERGRVGGSGTNDIHEESRCSQIIVHTQSKERFVTSVQNSTLPDQTNAN